MLLNYFSFSKVIGYFFFALITCSINAQTVPLDTANWKTINHDYGSEVDLQTTTYKGKAAIHLSKQQVAILKNRSYENFVVEFDMAGNAMPGIGFHHTDNYNYEFFYARVFSGGKNTALQYIPVFNGAHPWQLYNHPTYERTAAIQVAEWSHYRIEVFNKKMRVFVDDKKVPNMEVELLQTETKSGAFFLKASFADAYFSQIEIKELTTSFTVKSTELPKNYLTEWEISEQIYGNIYAQGQFYNRLNEAESKDQWQKVNADRSGVINIAQYFEYPKESVFAKTNISADEDKTVTLGFDYTQVMMIVFNDQVLFFGRELDTGNFMRVFAGEEKISLSLKKGDNKLVFWIRSDDEWQRTNPPYLGREQAMNWGFAAYLEE